jgi:hypothetical protein
MEICTLPSDTLVSAVAEFGRATKSKLKNASADGAPEDQLRAPLEALFRALAKEAGFGESDVVLVGEATLAHLQTRPDYAVTVKGALCGFIEVKAPGKGSDPRKFAGKHDKAQWAKLKSLPNLIYTDGQSFTVWRDGERTGETAVFEQDIAEAGARLALPSRLLPLAADFFGWAPIPPKNAKGLATILARLCRLLRDEVVEQLAARQESLVKLAGDWRTLLFPQADDAQFADSYAQAVTFGLLMARAFDVPLKDGIEVAAVKLKLSNSLIGTALQLLTGSPENPSILKTSLGTLTRVLNEVNWHTISKDKPEAWLLFYEDFLEVYDNKLRKQTGSYYTPPEVVEAMTGLVHEALKSPLFDRPLGLAAEDVTIADPAVGTGTFILGLIRQIAAAVAADQGEGGVPAAVKKAASRLYAFEMQFGPFAVAQLRLLAEFQALLGQGGKMPDLPKLNLFITDTLANPFVEDEQFQQIAEPVAQSRRDANKVKKGQPIMVVIGNPPYKEKAEGIGGWVEAGSDGRPAPLDRWKAPKAWGLGTHGKNLKNLYVYFWRWATLKAFGAGWHEATGEKAADREGLVCFITVAGFLAGKAFEKMRDDLRRTASAIWIVDCSPEGYQPDTATRIFQGVQQPICIVLAARTKGKSDEIPAPVWFTALPKGDFKTKVAALKALTLVGSDWREAPSGWRENFLAKVEGAWADFPILASLFRRNALGSMSGRTWVVAPDQASLHARWKRLLVEQNPETKQKLFHPHLRRGTLGDKHLSKKPGPGIPGHLRRKLSVADDSSPVVDPIRYPFRTLDRQWIIPDARLINQPSPTLWEVASGSQVFLTGIERSPVVSGPAISFAASVPDHDHYKGSFAGRVYPLWADAAATIPNVKPALLALLAETYGREVKAEDVMAYIAGVMAHPAFTARFREDLRRPGLRLPLTADADLFERAAALGRRAIWLHTYGERFADAAAGRPKGAPRLDAKVRPTIPKNGEIPDTHLPATMTYDAPAQRLHIGEGFVDRVTPAMRAYEVSGKNVLDQWFSYRRRDRSKPPMGDKRPPSPLEEIVPDGWLPEYTSDLLDLLNVLGLLTAMEPDQAAALSAICDGPLLGNADLAAAGVGTAGSPEPEAEGEA